MESFDIKLEVEGADLVIVLPRKLDDMVIPWQQAWQLGDAIEAACRTMESGLYDHAKVREQSAQVRLATHKGKFVVLFFGHVDRVRLCVDAARSVASALKIKAQDLNLSGAK